MTDVVSTKQWVEMSAKTGPRHHATSDVVFDEEETEFLKAMEEFKRSSGKKFPTFTDCMRVLKSLGWTKGLAWEDGTVEIVLAG